MESHKRILGVIYIVSALLQTMVMFTIGFLIRLFFGFVVQEANPTDAAMIEFILRVMEFLPAFVFIFLIAPSLIAGIGLLAEKEWALTMAMIVGCLKLFSFPIGTAIGVYAIWVYFEDKRLSSPPTPQP